MRGDRKELGTGRRKTPRPLGLGGEADLGLRRARIPPHTYARLVRPLALHKREEARSVAAIFLRSR